MRGPASAATESFLRREAAVKGLGGSPPAAEAAVDRKKDGVRAGTKKGGRKWLLKVAGAPRTCGCSSVIPGLLPWGTSAGPQSHLASKVSFRTRKEEKLRVDSPPRAPALGRLLLGSSVTDEFRMD